jgi:glutathione S-transferase
MPAKLYVVHGSHPCKTVEKALQLKGVAYKTIEIPPPSHALVQRMIFGARTVPGIRFEDGEKVIGSRAILARLDERVPEPALLPADAAARDAVLEAERWGDEVFQPVARRILWVTLRDHAAAAPSYSEGGKLKLPGFALRASMPLIARVEMKMNGSTPQARAEDLRALPGHLDRIDGWIADGTMGGAQPNRADLQIAPTLSLLMTMQDLRAIIAPRPAGQLADRLLTTAGSLPAGSIPASELPQPAAA